MERLAWCIRVKRIVRQNDINKNKMNTKNIYPIIILIIMVVFSSCSDEQNTKIEKKQNLENTQ